jgi:predicted dehydrogenase
MEKGIFHIEDNTLWKIEQDGSRTVVCKSPRLEGIKFYYGSSHTRLIARFYNAVKNNTDDYIHISEGAMIVKLMDSIFRSSNTGRIVEV